MISLRRRRREADPDELDGWTGRVRDNAGQAVVIVAVAVLAGIAVHRGAGIRDDVLTVASRATDGSYAGMAVAGWLVPTVPLLLALLHVTVIDDLRAVVRWPFLLVIGAAAGLALMFLPGSGEDLADLVTGPGAGPFATGLRWSAVSVLLGTSVLGWLHLEGGSAHRRGRRVADPRQRRRARTASLLTFALSGAALVIALVRAA